MCLAIKKKAWGSDYAIVSAMARQWRIQFEGACYHILSRGNERRNIFRDDDDRVSFLDILGKMADRFRIEVFAYVLMDNHYHLLLKTNKPNISKSMQWFGATYTRRYNIKHKRSGHLFQGRFKNFLIENMVQNYSQEEKRGWEDFRYGLFLGSRNFVERIKSKYLTKTLMLKYLKNDRY